MSGNAYTLWGADHHADAPLLESLWEDHAPATKTVSRALLTRSPNVPLCESDRASLSLGADPVMGVEPITGTRFNPQQDSGVPGLTARQGFGA